jgi:hypothetical protein
MKQFTGWMMSAGLVFVASAANAQGLAPYGAGAPRYAVVSDFQGPYAAMPEAGPVGRDYGPSLLPPQEVYSVLRDNGFSPLGIPHQRGFVYTIAVIDRGGEDGRLVIDARNGRILRFVPAYRMGDNFNEDIYGPAGPPPPPSPIRGGPRPPAPIPHLASRAPVVPPLPKPAPPRAGDGKPLAAAPPAERAPQQSAAVQAKPADAPPLPATVGQAKPAAPQILPTQPMPKMQGLD